MTGVYLSGFLSGIVATGLTTLVLSAVAGWLEARRAKRNPHQRTSDVVPFAHAERKAR